MDNGAVYNPCKDVSHHEGTHGTRDRVRVAGSSQGALCILFYPTSRKYGDDVYPGGTVIRRSLLSLDRYMHVKWASDSVPKIHFKSKLFFNLVGPRYAGGLSRCFMDDVKVHIILPRIGRGSGKQRNT
jgi:hypothetical protein